MDRTTDNVALFRQLLAEGRIRVRDGEIFRQSPAPLPAGLDFSRVEGMLLGLAIGDALGNATESQSPRERRAQYGEIRDYLPSRRHGDRRGYPSDDTQMAFWTLEQIFEDGRFDPASLARRFARRRIFGIGNTVRQFQFNYGSGKPWERCGDRSAGNGSLMRIAPILVPHLRSPSPALWADTALCGMITHNDSMAIASCVAFVAVLWDLLAMEGPPAPEWWLERFISILKDAESNEDYRPRSPHLLGFRGPLWRLLDTEVRRAWENDVPALEAFDRWYSGAYLLETVPCVLYILMKYGGEPEEAIVRAVNDTRDNDTVAAIVGAAVGALHDKEALPERWIQGLSGRTQEDDDGRVFELIQRAREAFAP